ncbi:hypothetical protein [Parafilimonas sp.]|uniref:hypothetical protein n=1 Tax=Parafilimonas sp. TaxID=1969739 RepID=UPI0039E6DFCA
MKTKIQAICLSQNKYKSAETLAGKAFQDSLHYDAQPVFNSIFTAGTIIAGKKDIRNRYKKNKKPKLSVTLAAIKKNGPSVETDWPLTIACHMKKFE